jgi:hypothetical protein
VSEIRTWWDQDEWPLRCERCEGTHDPMTAVGRRQLCTACREALDLCTMCAAPALFGEGWCSDCELGLQEYLEERPHHVRLLP